MKKLKKNKKRADLDMIAEQIICLEEMTNMGEEEKMMKISRLVGGRPPEDLLCLDEKITKKIKKIS